MDLTRFPFDTNSCELFFLSFTYNTDEVKMRWTEKAVEVLKRIELADYMLVGTRPYRKEEVTLPICFHVGIFLIKGLKFSRTRQDLKKNL